MLLALTAVLALLLLLAIYLAISVPGAWFPTAAPRAFSAKALTVARGTGQWMDEELQVVATDPTGVTLIVLVAALKASDYAAIAWIAADMPDAVTVRLLWRTDTAPDKVNATPVSVESGRTLPVTVANNPAWIGHITGLALAIQGPLPQPIRIRGVIAKPMGALEVLGDRLGEWFAFEGWTGTSINTVAGGADVQDLPLPVLLALTVALAAVIALVVERRRPGALGASEPVLLGTLFLIAWLILDARWAVNLVRQERQTAHQYAGKSLRDKHLAADDSELFAFVERAREVMPPSPARIFVAADANYFRGRAAYHLYPHSAFFDARSNGLQWARLLRPADWLLVYHQDAIQFDPSQQTLRWETGQTTSAELKLAQPGAALYRIR